MEDTDVAKKEKTSVFKNIFNDLSLFARKLTKNEDDYEDINDLDINRLEDFSEEEREKINEINRVTAQLRKVTNNAGNSSLYRQKNVKENEKNVERKTTVMKTVVNENIRG